MSIRPPRVKMPPLNALRAFEAAARLGVISRAADELCVNPGAVAQHIKSLEDWADKPLFHRHAKGVDLTELGQRCAEDFEIAFDHLSRATQNLRTRAPPIRSGSRRCLVWLNCGCRRVCRNCARRFPMFAYRFRHLNSHQTLPAKGMTSAFS